MELLKKLYCIHSKSGNEHNMVEFIMAHVDEVLPGAKVDIDNYNNIYITKGESKTYPCVVAHTDQVQHIHSKDFMAVETDDIIFGYSKKNKRFEGLGADDKNGIWIALKCLMDLSVPMKVALFTGEEIGCVGSSHADMSFFDNVRFVIEPDRRGSGDLITNICMTSLCSRRFIKAIGYKTYGYKKEEGLLTDVLTLKERDLGVSCVNISCGYYDPHTDNEFTVKKDLLNALDFTKHIITSCTSVYRHKYESTYINSGKGSYFNSAYMLNGFDKELNRMQFDYEYETAVSEAEHIMANDPDMSFDDLLGIIQMYYPALSDNDIKDIYDYVKANNYCI